MNFYFIVILCITGLAACNGSSGTTGTSDSTATPKLNPGDSSVTSTTTTTVTHHKYAGRFVPKPDIKYVDLKTHETITVRIDTERGEVVNSVTNEPVYLFVEPIKHDTIYGLTGSVVNNYIIHDESGELKVDTMKINAPEPEDASAPTHTGNYKEKVRPNKTIIKTDDYKIKIKNGEIKKIKDK